MRRLATLLEVFMINFPTWLLLACFSGREINQREGFRSSPCSGTSVHVWRDLLFAL